MIKTKFTFAAAHVALALGLLASTSLAAKSHHHAAKGHHALSSPSAFPEKYRSASTMHDKIAGLVYVIHPQKGVHYSDQVASAIIRAADLNHVPPLVIAATAYIESELSNTSQGGLGMMQISPATYRAHHYQNRGLHASRMTDNIQIGAEELSSHFRSSIASRSGSYDRRLAVTWGRYNGSGSHSGYVARARRVYKQLVSGSPVIWKRYIQTHGALWK